MPPSNIPRISGCNINSYGNVVFKISNYGKKDMYINNINIKITNTKTRQIAYNGPIIPVYPPVNTPSNTIKPGQSYYATWYNYADTMVHVYLESCRTLRHVPTGSRSCPGAPIGTYTVSTTYTDNNNIIHGMPYVITFNEKLQTYVSSDKKDVFLLGCNINNKCKRFYIN
jgi:hypothetical protein